MPVSANTLFHFTRKDVLLKILESGGFWPQYSLEHFKNALPATSNYISAYIPMVCFCDLKLTQISDDTISKHTKYFGNFGIGFKKNWGIKHNISPVVYVHQNSVASLTIDKVINSINNSISPTQDSLIKDLGDIVKFLKPYTGSFQKGKKLLEEINYYDEREWRYIPKDPQYEAFPQKKADKKKIERLNFELQKQPLKFRHTDIKYIILENTNSKQEVAEAIQRLSIANPAKFDLITKIITLEEIKEDF